MKLTQHLPIIELGIMMVFEYGSSSTGITVTSNLLDEFAAVPLDVVLAPADDVVVANVLESLVYLIDRYIMIYYLLINGVIVIQNSSYFVFYLSYCC